MTIKIIQSKFGPKDIIYLFFNFKGNNEYSMSPIFEHINKQSMGMNKVFNEVLEEIKQIS